MINLSTIWLIQYTKKQLDGNTYALNYHTMNPNLKSIYFVMYTENLDNFLMILLYFLEEFTLFVRMVKQLNRSSYICGDYNIDLLKIKTNKHFNDFFDNLISVGFFPKITLPTRFTEQSSTLIDNVFSNNIEEREISGILLNHISDHQFLFTYIEKLSYIEKVPKFVDIEKTDANSLENFIQELNDMNIISCSSQ